MKKERIVLGGFAGSGKSTVAKIVCERLGYEFISVGDFSREYAKKEFGLSINQFQEKCKMNPELDKIIDKRFQDQCNNSTKLVVDYRLGFKFINDALSVFLNVSDSVAAERLSKDKNSTRVGEQTDTESIKQRNNAMRSRFKELYDIDFADKNNYDLVIDTDNLSPERVADKIIEGYKHISNKT